MARFPDGFVDEVRAASSILGVVSSFVPLKKAGRGHKGLCPFHNEKTPSFNVDEERGIFHCFGCGAGGDIFRFIMQYEKVGFPDSVRRVATMSGIALPAEQTSALDGRRERLFAVNEAALNIFRATLAGADGREARAYLDGRNIEAETVETFELGLTPSGWEGVSRSLIQSGHRSEEIVAAGLAKERPNGTGIYDRFHERLMFPIRNAAGRLVGFGGRTLVGRDPKYLNSPETEIYHKSEVLYGFNVAKEAIRRSEQAVLVEGYLDLIPLHQAGVKEVVASLGTSLTEQHARLIARFTRDLYLAYDGDAAGINATRRALRVLLPMKLKLGVVRIDDGMDPDDLIRTKGGDAFREAMASASGFVTFLLETADGAGAGTPESQVRQANEVLPFLALLEDPVERAAHAARLAEGVGVDDSVVREALGRAASERRPRLSPSTTPERRTCTEAEGVLLMAILGDDPGRDQLMAEINAEDFAGLSTEPLYMALVDLIAEGGEISTGALAGSVDDAALRDLLVGLAMRHAEVGLDRGQSALQALRRRRVQAELRTLQQQLAELDGDALDTVLHRRQELSRELDELG